MGHGRVERAVADAGPLIHLHEVGQTDLLNLFEVLCIPDAVWAESADKINISPLHFSNGRRHILAAGDVNHFVQAHSLSNLHADSRGGSPGRASTAAASSWRPGSCALLIASGLPPAPRR